MHSNGRMVSSTKLGVNNAVTPESQKPKLDSDNPMAASGSGGGSSSTITGIAQDQLFSVLLLLPIQSVLCFATTCKRLKLLAYSDPLWESICRRDWGHAHVDALLKGSKQLQWKKLYQQVYQSNSVYSHKLLGGGGESPDGGEILPNPRPRASHSLNLVSGYLVLFGGGCEGGRHLDDSWIARVESDKMRRVKWQKTNSGNPPGRFGHSCVVIGDCLVLFGGINDHGIRQDDIWVGQVMVDERLGSATLSWRLLDVGGSAAAPPPTPRGAHAGCRIDHRRMLIHGGIGPSGIRLCDTWVLDLTEDLHIGTWREILAMGPCPPPRSGHTLTHIGGTQTILFGGRGLGYEVLNDVWLFDSSDWRWVPLAFDISDIPLPRVGHSACMIIGRRLLIYGGEDSNRHRKDDFWVLDIGSLPMQGQPPGNMWKQLESKGNKAKCRSFQVSCVDDSGCFLYVHGGMVDGLVQPDGSSGLRFDGEIFLVELVLQKSKIFPDMLLFRQY